MLGVEIEVSCWMRFANVTESFFLRCVMCVIGGSDEMSFLLLSLMNFKVCWR